nr:MAG TPA: hypothetical protein [Caudoviricetes sp.]
MTTVPTDLPVYDHCRLNVRVGHLATKTKNEVPQPCVLPNSCHLLFRNS